MKFRITLTQNEIERILVEHITTAFNISDERVGVMTPLIDNQFEEAMFDGVQFECEFPKNKS